MTADRVWHKGPPRFTGWWNASVQKDEDAWRWWDGKRWSWLAFSWHPAKEAAYAAVHESMDASISWTDYWPENARVPRLDPTGGHWTFNVDGKEPWDLPARIDIATRNFGLLLDRPSSFWDWELLDDPTDPLREGDILAWRPAA